MGKLDDLISAVGKAAPESKYIRAYHASPYDFDRFDFSSHMGRGEGGQAYAHGGYFAGDEEVQKFYRRGFQRRHEVYPDAYMTPEARAAQEEARAMRANWDQLLSERGKRDDTFGLPLIAADDAEGLARQSAIMARLDELSGPQNIGRSYEVDIAHPERALLDWDSTLDTQQHLLPQVERAIKTIPDQTARYDSMIAIEEPSSFRGSEVHAILRNALGGEPAAARTLLDSGIPGMRYLDGKSRSAGQGSRNYVMFPGTEDSIRILRKYGLLAPMAAAGMGGE
jgi:hypothetical protein